MNTAKFVFVCVVFWLAPVAIGVFASYDISAADPSTWEPKERALFGCWTFMVIIGCAVAYAESKDGKRREFV